MTCERLECEASASCDQVLDSYIRATEACDGDRLRSIFHPKVGAFGAWRSREAVMHGYIGQKEFVGVEGFFKQMEQQKAQRGLASQ